tara:strand:- start:8481 stop:9074 length:594 start_codon:yes stop_codon:yes gene_type:complete
MGRTMDVEDALAEAKEEIAALRREKEQHKSEMQSGYGDRTNARMASAGGGDMAALKRSLDSDWDLSEAESKAAMMDRRLLSTGRNPDAYKMDEGGMTESKPARRIGQPSAGRSAVLGEYRSDPAWEAGFQSVLMNRDSYGLSELDGSALRADGAREGVLVSRGDTDSLNDLGRSEALEFLEREAKKIDRQSLIEGMQ